MTTVVIHGHNTMGDPHGPVLMMTGTMDVIDDMRKTLTTREEAPAVLVALPIGHLNVLTEIAAGDCKMCVSPWITPEPNAKWKAQML